MQRLLETAGHGNAHMLASGNAGLGMLIAALVYGFIGFMYLQWYMASMQVSEGYTYSVPSLVQDNMIRALYSNIDRGLVCT